jgi:hypothetical protein
MRFFQSVWFLIVASSAGLYVPRHHAEATLEKGHPTFNLQRQIGLGAGNGPKVPVAESERI